MLNKKGGWNLNRCQHPTCIHLVVSLPHTEPGVAERFVADVRECAERALADPALARTESAAFYGMCQSMPDRGLIGYMTYGYLDALYVTGADKRQKDDDKSD